VRHGGGAAGPFLGPYDTARAGRCQPTSGGPRASLAKPPGPLPEALAAFCRTQVSIQRLLIEAYRQRSRRLLLQALLLDPCIDSVRRAEEMLDAMLELQKDYLPQFG
jgi:alpha-galactosidase/6-phospho-beta-glucosidase family protein